MADSELTDDERVWAMIYPGWLLGMSRNDRHAFSDQERASLRKAAQLLVKLLGRPDLIPPIPDEDAPEGGDGV